MEVGTIIRRQECVLAKKKGKYAMRMASATTIILRKWRYHKSAADLQRIIARKEQNVASSILKGTIRGSQEI